MLGLHGDERAGTGKPGASVTSTRRSPALWRAAPIRCRACTTNSSTKTCSHCYRWNRTRWDGTTLSRSPARARGYEERGFPGHANCSDNITAVYAPYGIGARAAWPAINFFFNSWIAPGDSRLRVDEAWSRPGDYVLMRALAPLVCVSTACPDDIDPINGWNPTDIYVRIYSRIRDGNRGSIYRSLPGLPDTMTRQSPFHKRTGALTSRLVAGKDLWAPRRLRRQRRRSANTGRAGAARPCRTCRRYANWMYAAPDAERFLQYACTRDMRRLAVHRATYALFCDERGAVIDDATICRLAPSLFRVCYGNDELLLHLRELAAVRKHKVWLRDKSKILCNLAVQGPKSRDALRSLIFTQPHQPRLENLKWFGMTLGRMRDRNGEAVMVVRSGYTGELGYELFCDRRDAEAVWDAVMAAGEPHGIQPMGAEALEMLRVEAGLMAHGAEFGGDWMPAECGLAFAADSDKEEFIGQTALAEHSPRHGMAGLLLCDSDIPSRCDNVYAGRRPRPAPSPARSIHRSWRVQSRWREFTAKKRWPAHSWKSGGLTATSNG